MEGMAMQRERKRERRQAEKRRAGVFELGEEVGLGRMGERMEERIEERME
jgi:hypothetical protein